MSVLAKEFGVEPEQFRKKFLATLIINHVLRVYLDYKNSAALDETFDSFRLENVELFSVPFIYERWKEVKAHHPTNFRKYMDAYVIPETTIFVAQNTQAS